MPFLGGRGQASRGYFGGATTPGAPTSVVSTKGNGQISVAFTAPSFDGGLPITTYEYALSTDSYATFTTRSTGTTASPLVITGLANGTSYGVKIRAVNSLGAGVASDAATAVTPSTVPDAPTSVSGTANGVTSSTVTWTAPANTGGAAITGYKVEYAASPYSSYTVFNANTGTTATSISVTGLTNGTSYKFRVSATNLNGFGATAESGVVVTNIVPAAPTIGAMTLSTTNTTDSLAWTAPTANGGSAITGYVYQTTTNDGSTFASALSTGSTATSKTFDPGYTTTVTKVRVAAVNSLGTGPYSSISAVGHGGWTSTAVTIPKTDCPLPTCAACPAPTCAACNNAPASCEACSCDCGTASRTASSGTRGASTIGTRGASTRGTASKTCYKWTRGAQETGASYNQNSTAPCDAVFSECTAGTCGDCTAGTCGDCTAGSCSACSACSGTRTAATGDIDQGGIYYTYQGPPGTYYAFPNPTCSSGCDFSSAYYYITSCLGVNTITLTDAGTCYNVFGEPC
jgi:hypothetical protein